MLLSAKHFEEEPSQDLEGKEISHGDIIPEESSVPGDLSINETDFDDDGPIGLTLGRTHTTSTDDRFPLNPVGSSYSYQQDEGNSCPLSESQHNEQELSKLNDKTDD